MRRAAGIVGLAGLIVVLITWVPGVVPRAAPRSRSVTMEVSSTAFRPAMLTLEPGDTVTIELVATDVVHGLLIEGYGLSVTAEPGRPGELRFVADRVGSFRLRCSVTCGPLHPFVVGRLSVGPNWLLWRGLALAVAAALLGLWLVRR